MKRISVFALVLITLLAGCVLRVSAQPKGAVVTVGLKDASSSDPVGFATVSLTPKGTSQDASSRDAASQKTSQNASSKSSSKSSPKSAQGAPKYAISDDKGQARIEGVKPGKYIFKAEIMGYIPLEMEVEVKGELVDLGQHSLELDRKVLDAASVSAVGNAIIVKKDTIEYNASSFKTTENDVLEDLLKKLPGVEIAEDGSITANGQTISKITIDGKTFFLNDPQLASKNLPAKMISKVKVVEKKSDQAEFTGIDDGEEEHIIDLSVKPGMMNGVIGNFMLGGGHDVPSTDVTGDYRFQGAGFAGKFTKKSNVSVVLNANNTNNRGFNDLSGSMMGSMRGGGGMGRGGWGGGNGITTSYMGGLNGSFTLFDDKMELGSNYLYNGSNKYIEETSSKITHRQSDDLISFNEGTNETNSYGHRLGARIEHEFSKNTSIIFEPQLNFGTGNFSEISRFDTRTDYLNGIVENTNDGNSLTSGHNRNLNASGFLLFRQRLGIPGRTLTVMSRYAFSQNSLEGLNKSTTNSDWADGEWRNKEIVDQTYNQKSNSNSLMGRMTYTEPIGNHFYVEANYSFNWRKSVSAKDTYDELKGHELDVTYSNNIANISQTHNIGANLLFQSTAMRAQVGVSAIPTHTYNSTTRLGQTRTYDDDRWRFSPRAMLWWEISENSNARMFYRGSSEQPSTSQLMPVPDNSDPLNINFGNPSLAPYFSHNLSGDFRYTNRKVFSSFNIHLDANLTQDPIVSAIWYGSNGAQYSMPFNGPDNGSFGMNMFANLPIAKSNFSIMNMARFSFSQSTSYVGGADLMIDRYYEDRELNYDEFLRDYAAGVFSFDENITQTVSAMERLRLVYRSDNLELSASGRTRVNNSWYTIAATKDMTTTWNNQLSASLNWTIEPADFTIKSDFNYNWYRGYTTAQPSEYILNAEIQKLVFKKKVTLALKGYDILGQSKNLSVSDVNNYHSETVNNTLGRYIIFSVTYRFGNFGGMRGGMRGGPGGGMHGHMRMR